MRVLCLVLCLGAAEGEKQPAAPMGRLCVVVPKLSPASGPFVAEILSESDTQIVVKPVGEVASRTLPRDAVERLLSENPPALKRYLDAYGELARARWIYRNDVLKPQLGYELSAAGEKVELRVLDPARGWQDASLPAGSFRYEAFLSAADIESVLGPIPVPQPTAEKSSAVAAEACARCGGKGTIPCPKCTQGKVLAQCPRCKGSGFLPCERCTGTRTVPCTQCKGQGLVRGYTLSGGVVDRPCPTCRGARQLKCFSCSGQGKQDCPECHRSGKKKVVCRNCDGTRKIPCPDCTKAAAEAAAVGEGEEPEEKELPATYARIEALAFQRAAAGLKGRVDERVGEGRAAMAAFGDVLARYRECMQSRQFSEFRTYLRVLRPKVNREVTTLYRDAYGLKDALERLCDLARKKVGMVEEQLGTIDVAKPSRGDLAACERRLAAAQLELAKFEDKPRTLKGKSEGLTQLLEKEVAAFREKQAEKAYQDQLCDAMREALGEISPPASTRVTLADDGAVIVVSAAGKNGKTPAKKNPGEYLAAVGDCIFPEFDMLQRIEVRTRASPLGTLERGAWEEDFAARQAKEEEKEAGEAALAGAEGTPPVGPLAAKEPESGRGSGAATIFLLLGGIIGSFLLLVLLVRARPEEASG
jgi:hypothetical protein